MLHRMNTLQGLPIAKPYDLHHQQEEQISLNSHSFRRQLAHEGPTHKILDLLPCCGCQAFGDWILDELKLGPYNQMYDRGINAIWPVVAKDLEVSYDT